MRRQVFIFILIALVVAIVLYFLWMVLRALYTVFDDVRTEKQLNQLATEYKDRRQERRDAAASRLENGCEHDYEDLLGAFPHDVCVKCGLAKEPPPGDCDHVWRRLSGAIPGSRCEKCGVEYGAAAQEPKSG